MPLSCYKCPKTFETIDGYINHLRNIEVLIPPCTLKCLCGGCLRTFDNYKSLKRHIKSEHQEFLVGVVEETRDNLADEDPDGSPHILEQYPDISECPDPPAVDEFRVSQAAFKFLMTLTASNSVSLSTTEFVKNAAIEMIQDIVSYLESRTKLVLTNAGLNDDPEVRVLMQEFNGWKNPFTGIDSHSKLRTYIKNKHIFVESEPHCL